MEYLNNITGLVVVYETTDIIKQALESIRRFYPALDILIIDGSKYNSECYKYLNNTADKYTKIIHTGYNIGHGNGMNFGIHQINTDYIMIFDSDIIMNKPPLEDMLKCFDDNVYGVGDMCQYDTHINGYFVRIEYLRPWFKIINKIKYHQYTPYSHNYMCPCANTMIDIAIKNNKSILINFKIKNYVSHVHSQTANYIKSMSK